MTERPILFSGPMVRAILKDRKTQTRRVVNRQPERPFTDWRLQTDTGEWDAYHRNKRRAYTLGRCPYGIPGDRLWVRETWRADDYAPEETIYYADAPADVQRDIKGIIKFKPSIHMPRSRSRVTLEVVNVRVERLQEISEDDTLAEGCVCESDVYSSKRVYRDLWDSLNAKRGFGWATNPWVWVVEFRRV